MVPARVVGQSLPPLGLEPQIFLPPASTGTTFLIERPTVIRHLSGSLGLGVSYAQEPIVRHVAGMRLPITRAIAQPELYAALGLFEYLELGLALPVPIGVTNTSRDGAAPNNTGVAIGSMRLSAKVPLLRGDFGLALRFVTGLPLGDAPVYLGSRAWTIQPGVVVAYRTGIVRIAGEASYRLRERAALANYEQDDELIILAGGSVAITPEVSAIGDLQFRFGVGGRSLDSAQIPIEWSLGARFQPSTSWAIDLGGGTGIGGGAGAPVFRVFGAVRFSTETAPCALGPEDYDGFEDGDFCADGDNDADGILDTADQCPNDAEDRDGFLDDDGCAELDNDADGYPDSVDRCPTNGEDFDQFRDEDGCPEPDNDEDGVPDPLDECPLDDPEDIDHYQDDDGCPEPGPAQATVTVRGTRILISERVYFDLNRDTIRDVSTPLLDQVAQVILTLPSDRHVRVLGHTDNAGPEPYNLDLSYRRARSVVEYLVSRGVPRERITYDGFGSRAAVAPNDTPAGRALNRRVEFNIVEPNTDRRRRRRDQAPQQQRPPAAPAPAPAPATP